MEQFTLQKYHCMGNDYLIYDPARNKMALGPKAIAKLCDRHFGIGADGVLVGPCTDNDRLSVKIYNSDGSEAPKGGNGMAIFARYLRDRGYVEKTTASFDSAAGEETVVYENEQNTRLKVSMGKPTFWSDEIPVTGSRREIINEVMTFGSIPYVTTCLSLGNPHCVIWMNDISKDLVCRIGQVSETAPYFPEKVNTQLLNVLDRTNIQIEIFERGAGYTLSSGTCACAAACAAYRMGLADRNMYVHMTGGTLQVEISETGEIFLMCDVGYTGEITLSNELCEQLRTLA
ncbi:MAG: diaminopimelate epimerase [Bacillota bacterium]|nr:diaminopimelate epimerase [Bacillota bacterium]